MVCVSDDDMVGDPAKALIRLLMEQVRFGFDRLERHMRMLPGDHYSAFANFMLQSIVDHFEEHIDVQLNEIIEFSWSSAIPKY